MPLEREQFEKGGCQIERKNQYVQWSNAARHSTMLIRDPSDPESRDHACQTERLLSSPYAICISSPCISCCASAICASITD
jgi:hypothetical protein